MSPTAKRSGFSSKRPTAADRDAEDLDRMTRSRDRAQSEADKVAELSDTTLSLRWASQAELLRFDMIRIKETMRSLAAFGVFQKSLSATQPSAPTGAIQLYQDDDDMYYKLFSLGVKHRMNFVPKRHIGWASWSIFRNAQAAVRNSCFSLVAWPSYYVTGRGPAVGMLPGLTIGAGYALSYLMLGLVVSPVWHLTHSLANNVRGFPNMFTGHYMWDGGRGRWTLSDLSEPEVIRRSIIKETDRLITVGRKENELRKRSIETSITGKSFMQKLSDVMQANMKDNSKMKGTKIGAAMAGAMKDRENADDHYAVLQVKKSATNAEIKVAYQRLAKALHPDRNPDDVDAVDNFRKVSTAYKVLSDPQAKRAYDFGGPKSKMQSDLDSSGLLSGTPQEILQRIFGGKPFENLIGGYYRTTLHLRTCHMCNLSSHDLEALICYRTQMLAVELAAIADVEVFSKGNKKGNTSSPKASSAHPLQRQAQKSAVNAKTSGSLFGKGGGAGAKGASSPASDGPGNAAAGAAASDIAADVSDEFVKRTEAFVKRLLQCSFGPELVYELGYCLELNAKRHLGEETFFAPKMAYFRTVFTGYKTAIALWEASSKNDITKQHVVSFFDMEWDNCVVEVHNSVRFAMNQVANDPSMRKVEAAAASSSGKSSSVKSEKVEGTSSDGQYMTFDEVKQRRLTALKYLGRYMQLKGMPYGRRTDDDKIMQLQKVAKTDANLKAAPPF